MTTTGKTRTLPCGCEQVSLASRWHLVQRCNACAPGGVFHRRVRTRPRGGNNFYLDRSPAGPIGTRCGADITDHDADWNARTLVPFGKWTPCPACTERTATC